MSKNIKMWLIILLVVVVVAGVSAYAATTYGTSSDPLITKSYLDSVLTPQMEARFMEQLNEAMAELESGAADTFKVVTLTNGQVLRGSVGCEIMLRIGSANVKADDIPGLVNTTSGTTLNNGYALTANNLYMVTIENNGIVATANTVKVMVKGSYTIG